ncbi:ferritin-like domain-containing protein [Changchengzhania lutea]|uniref:ferritin-like domain-containing protein n=1 Tax=Changchengzhania lutea TaxID=2049305 RepID=UPI00115C459C|nr:PA2169 family four-helix-bundle protein [Changchengzhania lutea]
MGIFNESTENKLNDLLEKAYDAEKGFEKACENVDSTRLKSFFKSKAEERRGFRSELRNSLVANGMQVEEKDGSVAGRLHRVWMDTKALFSTDNEESMLEEVRNGEKAALEDYDDVLESCTVDSSTKQVLQKQRSAIQASCNKADYLEDIL